MIYIVDAYAWVEYSIGSEKGLILKKLLNNRNNKLITMECTISELKAYCLRTDKDFSRMYGVLKRNSIILPVLTNIWLEAAEARHEIRKKVKDFGLIDAILIAKQNELKCMIVSGDPHFKNLKNVVHIPDSNQ